MSLEEKHQVISEIRLLVNSGFLLFLGCFFFVLLFYFLPVLVVIVWLFYLSLSFVRYYFSWRNFFKKHLT